MNQNQDTTQDDNTHLENDNNEKPDDYAGMYIRGHITITDLKTGEVLVKSEA